MKKIIISLFAIYSISALAPSSPSIIGTAYANNDPIPGIDVIIEKDPEENPDASLITMGDCWRQGSVILKNKAGKWKCVTKSWAKQKYPGVTTYSKQHYIELRDRKGGVSAGVFPDNHILRSLEHDGSKNKIKFKTGSDLSKKVN